MAVLRSKMYVIIYYGPFVIASKLTNVSNVLKFTKAMLWYYCFENKTDDSQPIRSLSPLGGKTIRLVPRYWVSTHMIGQKWNSQLSLVPRTHKFEWILKDEGHDPDYVYKEVKSRIKTFITPKTFQLWTSLFTRLHQSLGGYSFCSFNSILRV